MIFLRSNVFCLVALVSFFVSQAAIAATISVGSLALAPDGSGEVEVTVTGTSDLVNLVGYEFQIDPSAGTSSQLRFVEEDEAFLSATNYLFSGNSAALDDGTPSTIGAVSTTTLPDDTFVGGDSTADFSNLTINGSRLLVRLAVQHDTGPADPSTTLGDTFSISLVPISGDSSAFAGGSSNTGFVDASFNGVAFDSTGGTVSIVIPEPSSLCLLAICGLGLLQRGRTNNL